MKNENKYTNRTFKSILIDAGKTLLASGIILIIGFLVLNWSAYKQIISHRLREYRGIEVETPLTNLAQPKQIVQTREVLEVTDDVDIQKSQIPELNIEITPFDDRIIIPRINQNVPVIRVSSENLLQRNWGALEKDIQTALKNGVVHYPGTSAPGQGGNTVITGHSSYFPWDSGRFKDVFALLHDVVPGDNIVVFYRQNKYVYEVSEIKIVMPHDIEILKPTPDERLTLITCTPIGTNLKRLIVIGGLTSINDVDIGKI